MTLPALGGLARLRAMLPPRPHGRSLCHAIHHRHRLPVELHRLAPLPWRREFGRRSLEPKRSGGGSVVEEKFLNLPNLVSIGRMASGPLIGWERKAVAEVASGSF
ncbi:hypothetical protein ZWY2020_005493 [Hordeum vulgare]|nr:hypothetical protein ZWY2020_005493 [Hordeum vulgare]